MFDISKRNIIFYGFTIQTEIYYYSLLRCGQVTRVKGIVDGIHSGEVLGSISLRKPNELENLFEAGDIILIMADHSYSIISDMLKKLGYKEFEDFIGRLYLDKHIVTINANCYGYAISNHLRRSKRFNKECIIAPIPTIYENMEGCIPKPVLKATDIFIHQDVRPSNPYGYKLSNEYIFPCLKNDCIKFCIPNLVGMMDFMFPTTTGKEHYFVFNKYRGMFFDDMLINEAYEKTKGQTGQLDKIVQYIEKYPFDKFKIFERYEKAMQKIKEREKYWNVKISDIMKDAIISDRFASDINHPTAKYMHYIAERTGEALGFDDVDDDVDEKLYYVGHEAPVWKPVRDILHMKTYKDLVPSVLGEAKTDTRGYIQEYIWYVYRRYIT